MYGVVKLIMVVFVGYGVDYFIYILWVRGMQVVDVCGEVIGDKKIVIIQKVQFCLVGFGSGVDIGLRGEDFGGGGVFKGVVLFYVSFGEIGVFGIVIGEG